jgi:hypothetical protein
MPAEELDVFYNEFMQEIIISAASEGDFNEPNFTEKICEFLEEEGFLTDYYTVSYKKKTQGIKVDAWAYEFETGTLNLIISVFTESDAIETLSKKELDKAFKRVEKFFQKSLDIKFSQDLDESDPAYPLAELIHDYKDNINNIKFTLITNLKLSGRVESIEKLDFSGYNSQRAIWDIEKIFRFFKPGPPPDPIIIDFNPPLSILPAHTGEESLESYLLALPGTLLASFYEVYGDRLLEQNVRTFLQFRGNVNKGLKNTILHYPEMFFAYNNGITATAEAVKIKEKKGHFELQSINNLQIVNGGQTTASIFTTSLQNKDEADLSKVFVQMKLTIISSDFEQESNHKEDINEAPRLQASSIISNISEYSNTQNKVNAADLSSNHDFHVRMEAISRRIWAPAKQNSTNSTKWFYERLRGSFNNKQTNLTQSQKKRFLRENPKAQLIVKTDIAKFIHSWEKYPHVVSMGAQKNFVKFIEGFKKESIKGLQKEWEDNEKSFNDDYFKDLVVKAILFRGLDKLIMKQPWYDGYKANIVTYSISKLRQLIDSTGKSLDFNAIYKLQETPDILTELLLVIAENMDQSLKDTPEGISNIGEWAKNSIAWENARKLEIDFEIERINTYLVSKEKEKIKQQDASKKQALTNDLEIEIYVVQKTGDHWKKVLSWGKEKNLLTPKEISILEIASLIPKKMPSIGQCKILIDIEGSMTLEGFLG